MIYSHFICRVGAKDAQVINGKNGSFMAVDVAVSMFSKGEETTQWVRVRSNKPNHLSLAKYLTRGKMLLVEGSLTAPTVWTDKNGVAHPQLSLNADVIRFVSSGRKKDAAADGGLSETNTAAQPLQELDPWGRPVSAESEEDLPF